MTMDSISIGKIISEQRKSKGLTQEQLANQLGVSPQAVSKWENGISCPDIMILPKLADIFEISIDELFGKKAEQETSYIPTEERKPFEKLIMRVFVFTQAGDRIRVNLPMPLIRTALEVGIQIPQINGVDYLKDIDLKEILKLVDSGLIGKLVEVETQNGDTVEVSVD